MADAYTFNQSNPSMNGQFPSDAYGLGVGATWGIDNTPESGILGSKVIIQSESITQEDITDDTQDQKGAVVNRLTYDRHYTLNLTFLTDYELSSGSSLDGKSGTNNFVYAGYTWFINSITYNGSYNAKKSYTLNAERYQNWPGTQS